MRARIGALNLVVCGEEGKAIMSGRHQEGEALACKGNVWSTVMWYPR